MRRLALLALVVPALAGAGCGGGKGSSGPLDEGLRYLPSDAPFAAAIDTDVNGGQYEAAGKLMGRFPGGGAVAQRLKQLFQRGGNANFVKDVKPLLGNPFVVGAVNPGTFGQSGERTEFVAAIKTKDGDKLKELVKKEGADQKGEKEGAKLYQDRAGDTFAVKGDVLIVAGTRQLLEAALKRRNGDGTLTEDKWSSALDGLPKQALVRSYFNVAALLRASPGGRQATNVRWVGALRTLGLTAAAANHSLKVAFNLKTDSSKLTKKDLPFAAGDSAPKVVRRAGELGLGVRNPGQLLEFAIGAGRATRGPVVDIGKRQIEQQLGIDVEKDVSAQLTGDTSVSLTPAGTFAVRAELKDPAAFKRTLAKVAPALPRVAEAITGGPARLLRPRRGGDLYALVRPGGRNVFFGVSRGVFVVAGDAATARRLASATPRSVPGARGSLVLSADARKLAEAFLRRLASRLGAAGAPGGQLFTGPLGDLTGSVKSGTDGMKGSGKLEVH